MLNKILAVMLAVGVVGCATSGGDSGSSGMDGGSGEFGSEGRADPGLPSRGSSTGGSDEGELRTVYFEYDQHSLEAGAKRDLRHNAQVLRDAGRSRVQVQGNCDERGSGEYNLALGMRRAEAAKRYLVDLGIAARRIDTTSFGEERPAVRGHSESVWARNRRDDFVLQ